MATSSITKEFKIKDSKIYDSLVKDLNKPSKAKTIKTSYLEEGKKLLLLYFFY